MRPVFEPNRRKIAIFAAMKKALKQGIVLGTIGVLIVFGIWFYRQRQYYGRLDTEGVTTEAVVTRVYSRVERRPGPGRHGVRRSREVTVYLLDYRFKTADDSTCTDSHRRSGNLMTARIGDRLLVRYLPERPSINRLERDSAGNFRKLPRPRPRRGRR